MAQSTMSWFGGVVDWLISSSGLAGDYGISQDNKQSQNLSSPVGGVALAAMSSTLNPNAKEFTPAKRSEFTQPSMTSVSPSVYVHDSPAITASQSDATSSYTKDTATCNGSSEKQNNLEVSSSNVTTVPCNDNSCEKQKNLEVSSSNVTPSGSACVTPSGSNCVTPVPDMEAPLRATTDRLCTPWVQQGDKSAQHFDETDEEILESFEGDDDDDIFSEDSNESCSEASSDEDDDDDDDEIALSDKTESTSIVGVEDR